MPSQSSGEAPYSWSGWVWTTSVPPEYIRDHTERTAVRGFLEKHKSEVRWADRVFVAEKPVEYELVLKEDR